MRHLDRRGLTVGKVPGRRLAFLRCAWPGRFSVISLALVVVGCAHTELNSNTVDIAGTIESLYKEQALNNLSRLIDDPNTIPSQVDISSGNVQTQDQLQAQGQFPLGNQVTTGGVPLAITQIQQAARQLTLQLSPSRTQSWAINPVTDSNGLGRLRAVYKYVINYPVYTEIDGRNDKYEQLYTYCTGREHYDTYRAKYVKSSEEELIQMCINERQLIQTYNLSLTATNNNVVVDASRIMEPQCVICVTLTQIAQEQEKKDNDKFTRMEEYIKRLSPPDNKVLKEFVPGSKDSNGKSIGNLTNKQSMTQSIIQTMQQQVSADYAQTPNNSLQVRFTSDLVFHVNDKLRPRWLYWDTDTETLRTVQDVAPPRLPPDYPEKTHKLGHYGNHQLLMTDSDYRRGVFADFLLFLLPQADPRLPAPPTSGGGGAGGGGGSGGGGSGAGGSGGTGKGGSH